MTDTNTKSKRKGIGDELKQDRRIKYGGYSSQVRQRYSDERTVEGRLLKARMDGLVNDLGGHEILTTEQRMHLDSIQSILIVVLQIGKHVDEAKQIIEDGELIPALGKNFLAYLNTLRLTLKELREAGSDNREKVSSLDAWISEQEKEQQKEAKDK